MSTQEKAHTDLQEYYSDTEAEAAFIAAVITDPSAVSQYHWVKSTWFTEPIYREAWATVLEFSHRGESFDHITILHQMNADETVNWKIDTAIHDYAPSYAFCWKYADIISQQAQRRACVHIASILAQAAAKNQVQEGIDAALQGIGRISAAWSPSKGGSISYRQILEELGDDVMARMDNPQGLRTGFGLLDGNISSMEPGMLIQIAGRPASGKSALGLSIARRIAGWLTAQGKGGSVEVVTMEMSAIAQARRLISLKKRGEITSAQMRLGLKKIDQIDRNAWDLFTSAYESEMNEAGDTLYFTDRAITSRELSLRLATAKAERNMKIAVIDQLDLFADGGRHGETERIGEISRELKQIARNLKIVIICLCQLNRETEKRQNHRPELSDLRQSGRIEQDADIVIGLYRPCYYREMKEGDPEWYLNYADAMILKNRDGESGIRVPLWFIPRAASYTDWPIELRYAPDVIDKLEGGR